MCNAFWSPALSEDLTGFEKLSGLMVDFYSPGSPILVITTTEVGKSS